MRSVGCISCSFENSMCAELTSKSRPRQRRRKRKRERYLFEFHSAQDLKALKAEAALPCNLDAVACGWITEPLPVSLLERRAKVEAQRPTGAKLALVGLTPRGVAFRGRSGLMAHRTQHGKRRSIDVGEDRPGEEVPWERRESIRLVEVEDQRHEQRTVLPRPRGTRESWGRGGGVRRCSVKSRPRRSERCAVAAFLWEGPESRARVCCLWTRIHASARSTRRSWSWSPRASGATRSSSISPRALPKGPVSELIENTSSISDPRNIGEITGRR
mmetsp:Transcript_23054/g.75623  ORF Transcript_23054/g.75623 Transcript_23054/m.75623 type:complete len:273 (-) Transcript_23054:67-885(-)